MKQIKNIIFDFDGVIIDSVKIKDLAFKKLVKKYNTSIQIKFYHFHRKNLGLSRDVKFDYLLKKLIKKYSYKEKKNLSIKFTNIIKKDIKKSKFIKGSRAFLKKSAHLNKFISSGTPQTELKKICERKKISHLFKEMLGSPSSKERHIMFLKKKYKINKKNTIYFGDSLVDYNASQVLGLKFIQIGNNFNNNGVKIKIDNFHDNRLLNLNI